MRALVGTNAMKSMTTYADLHAGNMIDGDIFTYATTGYGTTQWIGFEVPHGSKIGYVFVHWPYASRFRKVELWVLSTFGDFSNGAALCGVTSPDAAYQTPVPKESANATRAHTSGNRWLYCGHAQHHEPGANKVVVRQASGLPPKILAVSEVTAYADPFAPQPPWDNGGGHF